MSLFDSISKALGTDSDQGWGGSIGKGLGLDNDTIKGLRLPALAAGAYFGAPYLMNYFGSAPEALGEAGGYGFSSSEAAGAAPKLLGEAGGYGGGGLMSSITGALGNKGVGLLAGALAGGMAGGDTTTSSSRDPWGPAQPYLLDNLKTNAAMQKYYQANPFSNEQKQAYQGQADVYANNQANAGNFNQIANSFMQSNRGLMGQMPTLTQGTKAAPIDWSKYANIGAK